MELKWKQLLISKIYSLTGIKTADIHEMKTWCNYSDHDINIHVNNMNTTYLL